MRRWKTVESVQAVEEYFDEITTKQIKRWASVGELDGSSGFKSPAILPKQENKLKDPSLLCYVCKQEFTRPKLLRCLHTFCMSCIESVVQTQACKNNLVVCPICATSDELHENDRQNLPTNFVVIKKLGHKQEEPKVVLCQNCDDQSRASAYCMQCEEHLCDNCTNAHKRVRVTRQHNVTALSCVTDDENNNPKGIRRCPKHAQEVLTYFCHTCDESVCRQCTVVDHRKPGHEFEPLCDATSRHRHEMAVLLEEARKRVPFIKRTLLEIEESHQEIPEHFDAIAEKIKESTEHYIRAIEKRQVQLLDDLDTMREYKTTVLWQQKERLSQVKINAEENFEFVGKVISEGSAAEVASVKGLITNRLEHLGTTMDDIEPTESPSFDFVTDEELIFKAIAQAGMVESGTRPSLVRVIGEGLYSATMGKTTTFTMASRHATQLNRDIDIRIETPDGVILSTNVTCHGRGVYTVSYSPKVHGDHVITVLARGEHVDGSPYSVYVKKGHMSFPSKVTPLCMRVGSQGNGRGQLDRPSGVAVTSNGTVIVSDANNHRIAIFHGRGNFLRQFGSFGADVGQMNTPAGVCFTHDGSIVVADQKNNRVQVFSPSGVFLQNITCTKLGVSPLKNPTGVAVDEEGQVVVADQHNHRIVVFSAKGKFSHEFGSLGIKDGQFNNPTFLAINQDGEIFVADTCNHRIQVFDSAGNFMRKFGRPGTSDGEFHYPAGITIDSAGYLFVSDRTNRVQVFNQDLRYVTMFGGKQNGDGQLSGPQGLDYTPEGKIAVADSGNDTVKVFFYPRDRF